MQLDAVGFDPGALDGIFGPQTAKAVRDYQADRRLTADGVAGPLTRKRLAKESAPTGDHPAPESRLDKPPASAQATKRTPRTARPPQLSETMRTVAQELSTARRGQISAFTIARAIAGHRPEYAGGRLGQATLTEPSDLQVREWEVWRDSVAELYVPTKNVASSKHEVIDGRLFVMGLGLIDRSLRSALDDQGVWTHLLLEVDETVAPAGSALRPLLDGVQLGHGYENDQASGRDQLGIQGEVNAVSAVITDPRVEPPLAVGLFGPWGSGKSFFMDRMRERIADVTGADRGRDLGIVQIRFNAWHYADTCLWASLAIEIFERLVDREPVDPDDRDRWLTDRGDAKRADREKLLGELETYRAAKAVLDAEGAQLQAERQTLEARRDKASQRRRDGVKNAPLTDVASALAKDPTVQKAIGDITRSLGLRPAVEELRVLAAELRTTAGYGPAVWRNVRHKTWIVALAAAFVLLTIATAALIVHGGTAWLGSIATAAGSVGAAVVAATRFVSPAARTVNSALEAAESAVATVSEIEAKLREKRSREELALEVRLTEIDREVEETTRAVVALDEKIAARTATAESLTVARRLYDFLADRAIGYQKHQGVVGMLHRDFRLLDAQLRAYSAGGERLSVLPDAHRVRVILYIDDLDRCPPAKVLEVLEAVHLLLALPLFVVVVGVDPRWLTRSLRHQYRDLVTSADPRTDPYLRDMPIEYLEKIFQIPLTLPAMEPRAYATLIAHLAHTDAGPEPAAAPAATTAHRAPSDESPGGDRTPTRALLEVDQGSSASGATGRSIGLTPSEVRFAQRLGPLVKSPRAAKRLLNTYRLIRATQHIGSRSRFLGSDKAPGEYQALLTLLAVAAGYPAMADRVLVALEEDADRHEITLWSTFVAALGPARGDDQPGILVPPDFRGPLLEGSAHMEAVACDEPLPSAGSHSGVRRSRRPLGISTMGSHRRQVQLHTLKLSTVPRFPP